jgi:2-iminobutanoate/2-iminopropanoate deaminase
MSERKVIKSEKAPQAIGPYSQGIQINNLVFTAGQLGIDRPSGNLVQGGIEEETQQALTNIKYILQEAGTSLENVVKTTVFLRDMQEFAAMNAVYATFFGKNPPARSTIQVAALPKDGAVEIEAIAVII